MLYLGVAGSAAFYLHTVVRFVEQPASLYRILPAVEIFSALAALLFVTALLRALYLPGRRRYGAGTQPLRAAGFLLLHLPCTAPGRMAGDERRGHAGLVSAGHHAGMHGPAGRGLRAEHCQAGMIL